MEPGARGRMKRHIDEHPHEGGARRRMSEETIKIVNIYEHIKETFCDQGRVCGQQLEDEQEGASRKKMSLPPTAADENFGDKYPEGTQRNVYPSAFRSDTSGATPGWIGGN